MKQQTNLTVLKTSVFFSGDGFSVYDSNGQLVFRVDSYRPRQKDDVVLMDPHGRALLTLRPKVPYLSPIFSVLLPLLSSSLNDSNTYFNHTL